MSIITKSNLKKAGIVAASMLIGLSVNAQFKPTVVVEEATGEWCGWCPRGIVAAERMYEDHPDGSFINIAVHYNDEFALPEYYQKLGLTGAPRANYNRMYNNEPVDYQQYSYTYKLIRMTDVVGKIGVAANLTPSGESILVTTNTVFGANSSKSYQVAIVLTENDVVGRYQNNYYAGGGNGTMGGFESQPSTIYGFVFNDVARSIYPSYSGSTIVSGVSDGDIIEKTFSVPVPATVVNTDNLNVIALLLEDGKIINAASTKLGFDPNAEYGMSYCMQFEVSPTLQFVKEGVKTKASFANTTNSDTYISVRFKIKGDNGEFYSKPQVITLMSGAVKTIDMPVVFENATAGQYEMSMEVLKDGNDYVQQGDVKNVTLREMPKNFKLSMSELVINDGKVGNVPINNVHVKAVVKCEEGAYYGPISFSMYPEDHNSTTYYANHSFDGLMFDDTVTLDFTVDLQTNGFLYELYIMNVMCKDANGNNQFIATGKSFYTGKAIDIPEVAPKTQNIEWSQTINELTVNESVTLYAEASSELPIMYLITEGANLATIEGNVLTANAEGSIEVCALQPGNESFYPAVPVTKTIKIEKESSAISDVSNSPIVQVRNGVIEVQAENMQVNLYSVDGRRIDAAIAPCRINMPARGVYILTVGEATFKIAY